MKLVILDLDETLVYADESLVDQGDYNIGPYGVKIRPHAQDLINFISSKWDMAVWTSSGSEYGPGIVAGIGIKHDSLKFLWTGDRCTRKLNPETREDVNIKDLRKVVKLGYSLKDIVMIDDSPEKLSRNYGNLVCVRSWEGSEGDSELELLAKYLVHLDKFDDVTKIEKRGWQTVNRSKWNFG